jgi:electron transport complex protein RnfD
MSEVQAVEEKKDRLVLPEWLTVSSSPHVKTNESTEKIMWTVNAALLPATAWGVYHFGLHALLVVLTCVIAAAATEYVVLKLRGLPNSIADGSAVLTGLLLALCLPPSFPLWMTALGSAFAVFIAKQSFGGLGQNIFNPAHIGRAFLLASFPVLMTTWSAIAPATPNAPAELLVDGVTTATPLGMLKEQGWESMTAVFGSGGDLYWRLFIGDVNGSIGEVSALFLLLGGAFLLIKRYISWEGPVTYIATVALLTLISGGDPIFAMLSGGLIIGAFFMITDYVTTPITRKGQVIFALGGGLLVWLIRTYGGYPEGVCYSILLMNCFTPLIDRVIKPKRYGVKKAAKGAVA